MNKHVGEISIVFVAFMYACLSVGVRFMNTAMSANIAFATRSFVALLVGFILYSLILKQINFKKYKDINFRFWLIYLFLGCFGYGASVLFLSYGVLKTNLFTVSSIFATIPAFVILFEFLFFKYKIKFTKIFFILCSIFGAGLCSYGGKFNLDFSMGALYILCATILSAVYIIGITRFQGILSSKELGIVLMFFASMFGFVFSLAVGYKINVDSIFSFYFLIGLLIGATFNLFSTILEPWAMSKIENPVAGSQILLLEVVFALFLGFLLFEEVPSIYSIIGSGIIVTSVAINNYFS